MLPVWLLDVDGVVNAERATPDLSAWPEPAWRSLSVVADHLEFPVLAASPVIEFIEDVHVHGAAEIRWHSSWRQWAVESLAPALGLPDFPVAMAPEFNRWRARSDSSAWSTRAPTCGSWWKVGAATRVVCDEERSLLWTDDELAVHRNTGHLASLRGAATRVQLVSPRADVGLTRKDLRTIAQFLHLDPSIVPARPDVPGGR